ncbi:MAG TPA: hypothetical protein O0X27_00295 [Methanocorpusculum sp.]|nr:hypothetical protein [Methanocorpusculum sp.]
MNVKKVLAITLVALVATLAFAGVASAFTYNSADYSVTPTGSVTPGTKVTATMKVSYPEGSPIPNQLNLDSQLVGVSWTVVRNPGAANAMTFHPTYPYDYVSNFDIYESSGSVSLEITASGTVSSESAGKDISPLTISESGGSGSVYTAPTQFVYDTGTLASSLQALNSGIATIEAAIEEYVAAGYDCSQAKANLETARAKYQAAVNAGTANGVTAFSNYEAGMAALNKAKQSVAYVSLSVILNTYTQIDDIITQLYQNGWNTEAKLVDTKNTKIKTEYDECLKEYQAGNADIAELKALQAEVTDLYNEATKYLEESQNPLGGIMAYLPYILIGVGVIVVGIIVFFVIRKRKGSWDELG